MLSIVVWIAGTRRLAVGAKEKRGYEIAETDKELLKWSLTDRTDAFLEIQNKLNLGEGKASK